MTPRAALADKAPMIAEAGKRAGAKISAVARAARVMWGTYESADERCTPSVRSV